MRLITEVSLAELAELIATIEEDERAALQLIAKPRVFFQMHEICIPMDAAVTVQHREELRAILHTPSRFRRFAQEAREEEDAVTIHVKKPIVAHCGKITIKCPKKKNQDQSGNLPLRAISEVSIAEVLGLVHTVEEPDANPDNVSQLSTHPTRFFQRKGLVVLPDVRVEVIDTNEQLAQLETERGINSFLGTEEREGVVAATAHVTGGAMNCKKIKYTCVK